MPGRCDLCGRTGAFGHHVSHSNRHTARRFHLNVHSRRLQVEGRTVRVRICTRCLRTLSKTVE